MMGHPAIAYVVAQNILDERREEARAHHMSKSVARRRRSGRPRTVRVGRYRLTITREVPGVPRTV